MEIEVTFEESADEIEVDLGESEILTGIGSSDPDADGHVKIFAVRESADDGDGNITL